MNAQTSPVMLEVKSLNKKFGTVHAVKDLNFVLHQGEILGFLGPNGAGKSTTMRIITGFIPLTSGSVKVRNLDIMENDLEVRKTIGYLPETTPLYNDMLVEEYLAFVGEIRGLEKTHCKRRIDEMLTVCGLTKMTRRQIGHLSKGYRQRVGLAQAIIHDPDLLILDEPTSGLDPNQIVEIRNLIKQIGAKKTVVYCSHILAEVSATCDRILIINEGAIVASGTPDELTSRSTVGNRYILTVKADRSAIEGGLSALGGVTSAAVTDSKDGWHTVQVGIEGSVDIGEQLFKLAVDKGWSLSELRKESASLEEVFTQLTRG